MYLSPNDNDATTFMQKKNIFSTTPRKLTHGNLKIPPFGKQRGNIDTNPPSFSGSMMFYASFAGFHGQLGGFGFEGRPLGNNLFRFLIPGIETTEPQTNLPLADFWELLKNPSVGRNPSPVYKRTLRKNGE